MELESAVPEYSARDSETLAAKKKVASAEVETDDKESTGSSSSSEDMVESPRSVVRDANGNNKLQVHSQILRLRAEDSHLGEDVVRKLLRSNKSSSSSSRRIGDHDVAAPPPLMMIFSRPILPASPLSSKPSVMRPG